MPYKKITRDDVELLREIHPTRRCFGEHPIIRERSNGEYVVSTIFMSIDRLFEHDTKIRTFSGQYGPYRYLSNPETISEALAWQERHKEFIFLRDMLHCSVALDYNLASAGVYTNLGLAEHNAKMSRDSEAIRVLAEACVYAIDRITFLAEADVVCAVPPSPEKEWDLPTEIVKIVSARTGKPDISPLMQFTASKKSVKAVTIEEKWDSLEEGGLEVDKQVKGQKIVLIDDKYQSGTTAQFVAAKLYDAGATEVDGLFCIKTWRNTDNR